MLNHDQTAILDILNVGHNQSIGGVNGDADVVGAVGSELELVLLWLVGGVDNGVFFQGNRECFDQDPHQGHLSLTPFNHFPHLLSLGDVELLMQVQVRDRVAFCH